MHCFRDASADITVMGYYCRKTNAHAFEEDGSKGRSGRWFPWENGLIQDEDILGLDLILVFEKCAELAK